MRTSPAPRGSHCEEGVCVQDDLCEGVVCTNPGEVCVDGECVSGGLDGDGDGSPARDDCDDTDPTIYPGADELCNGQDDDCDELTADGESECPGRCCGEPPACQQCCFPLDCGDGQWECVDHECLCDGVIDGAECVEGGECIAPEDCGEGSWSCEDHGCRCDGVVCGETCHAGGTCCEGSNCGAGDWNCTDHACQCSGVTCGSTCYAGGECCVGSDCGAGDWSCSGHACQCSGVTCNGTCYAGGDCCSASDCGGGHTCTNHQCVATEPCASWGRWDCMESSEFYDSCMATCDDLVINCIEGMYCTCMATIETINLPCSGCDTCQDAFETGFCLP